MRRSLIVVNQYHRLYQGESIVGFRRDVESPFPRREYLRMGDCKWTAKRIEHTRALFLSKPPIGVEALKRLKDST